MKTLDIKSSAKKCAQNHMHNHAPARMAGNRFPLILMAAMLAFAAVGCSDSKKYETAMCVLVDVSETYVKEKASVVRIVKAGIVPNMISGDSLFLITIEGNSYTRDALKATLNLDYIPSKANDQKIAFAKKLDEFATTNVQAPYTDVSGAMMLCSDYLKDTGSGHKSIMIFSDMQEDLKKGVRRNFRPDEFAGVDIAALNVIKLKADSNNPAVYSDRLNVWKQKVMKSGAKSWATILEPVKIPEYLEQLKR